LTYASLIMLSCGFVVNCGVRACRSNTSRACQNHQKFLIQIQSYRRGNSTKALSLHAFLWQKHDPRHFSSSKDEEKIQVAIWEREMEEMKEEREALFGFTDSEKDAWSNASGHTHKQSFLDSINEARLVHFDIEESSSIVHSATSPSIDIEISNSFSSHALDNSKNQQNTVLSHLTPDGESVKMVDIGDKQATQRIAVAQSTLIFPPEVARTFQVSPSSDGKEILGPKGPIFATAKLAGIMAAKKTSDLIPLCHRLPLDKVDIDIQLSEDCTSALIRCECRVSHKTGVEMEALTGASVASLTIYDMVKAISHEIRIQETILISKRGGKRTVGENSDNK